MLIISITTFINQIFIHTFVNNKFTNFTKAKFHIKNREEVISV